MSSVSLNVFNWKGESLSPFSIDPTDKIADLDRAFIKDYLYKLRLKWRGENKFAHTKGVSQVAGTTKKPYNQKGTGNARQGSLRSPQFRGGGIVFGPLAIKRKVSIQKTETKLAKKMLLSFLLKSKRLVIVEDANLENHKTKNVISFAQKVLGHSGKVAPSKTLFVISRSEANENFQRATNNIFWAEKKFADGITAWSLVFNKKFVFTKAAITEIFA
jgi:large subunit ribosomal protein L4